MKKIENIRTNNIPLLDELVYNLKKIISTCVVKDNKQASGHETLDIMKMSDRYITCIEGNARFDLFNYTRSILEQAAIPESIIDECIRDKNNIPSSKRKLVVDITSMTFINNYIEKNNYYRMLNGLPDIGDSGILVPYKYLNNDIRDILDTNTYIHEMSNNSIDILYSYNIIDRILEDNPSLKYLNYMGLRKISIYEARKADNFSLLYIEPGLPDVVTNRFRDNYEMNMVYTLKTVYNEAFKIGSDYYDNFIQLFILLQTMIDILADMSDMIIKKEIFDIRMVKLIFDSNGVDFFREIPMKYQMAMVRNLNRLIKFKSTTKNIIDICSLFGFNNIEVFKYYLLKERTVDKYGEYQFNYIENEAGELEEDNEKNYELKFIKVPIDDIADNYLNDKSKILDYDDIVIGDKYWNGDLPHDFVKKSILERDFNYIQSKYLSVDTLYSMADLSFQLIYFYNMIFDDIRFEELLMIRIPSININKEFRFVDIMCLLYSLTYEYNNFEDNIFDTPTKVMHIKGFNFKVDLTRLGNHILEKGYTMEELGVDGFQIPDSQILTYNQLLHIFTKNKEIHDHIVNELYNADNKDIYDLYKIIYDSLMITDLTNEFFRKDDGDIATTYTDYIKSRDIVLYDFLITIKNIDSVEQKREKINNITNDIIYIIEQHLETDRFNFIFSQLPSVSAEAIKLYIYKVVNFFKSYKVDIYSINTIYKFDDKLENKIKTIDKIIIQYLYNKESMVDILDKLKTTVSLTKQEKVDLIDQLYMSITYWIDLFFSSNVEVRDEIKVILIDLHKTDCVSINEHLENLVNIKYNELITTICKKYMISELDKTDILAIKDEVYFDITYWVDNDQFDTTTLIDKYIFRANINIKEEHYDLYSNMKTNTTLKYDSKINITDVIQFNYHE